MFSGAGAAGTVAVLPGWNGPVTIPGQTISVGTAAGTGGIWQAGQTTTTNIQNQLYPWKRWMNEPLLPVDPLALGLTELQAAKLKLLGAEILPGEHDDLTIVVPEPKYQQFTIKRDAPPEMWDLAITYMAEHVPQ
jgi:hypothetical protein